MGRLEGRIAIVTGSGGIGEACARRLAADGATVVIGDVAIDHAREIADDIVAHGGKASARAVDISDEASVIAFFAEVRSAHGRLDVLHNNAADTRGEQMALDMGIADMPVDIWDQAFHVNARGTMLMTKHALPLMLENRRGSIINTSSGAALRGDLYGPAYASSKAAINCLTLYTATQYGKQGIRCNVISPGLIVTPNVYLSNSQEQLDRIEKHKLTPYLGVPEDIAAAVSYLASDEARFMTAQIMVVDGGVLDHMPYFSETITNFQADPANRSV
jgi:NAD(P)-dependent dehydrogenase (short-subunit alcohol dehydrogenase family)